MIELRIKDLLEQDDINVICHICNLHQKMAAGIAKAISAKYPEAFEADKATPKDDPSKLGTFSFAKTDSGKLVVNIYAMPRMGELSYDAFYKALVTLRDKCEAFNVKPDPNRISKIIGIPYNVGCDLAGGDFYVVSAIIKSIFGKSPVKVIICRLPSQRELPSVFDAENEKIDMVKAVTVSDDEVF